MKSQLIAIVAAVLVVGCGESQQSAPPAEAKPAEPVAEASQPEPPDISIHDAALDGNIEAVKQHLAAGTDVNAKTMHGGTPLRDAKTKEIAELLIAKGADVNVKDKRGFTPLHYAARGGRNEIAELLISKGADVNAKNDEGKTALDEAKYKPETADLLRKHGAKTAEELKAEGK